MNTKSSPAIAANMRPYRIDFRAGGQGLEFLIAGWSYPETEHTWTLGSTSIVRFPRHSESSDCSMLLAGVPLVLDGSMPFQRLVVSVNGTIVANLVARIRLQTEIFVPAAVIGDGPMVEVTFHLPDAMAPSEFGSSGDTRLLGFAMAQLELKPLEKVAGSADTVRRAEDRAILMDVQSLGANCELGFVQRHFGAEPFGLLRWAFTPLQTLLPALAKGFDGFGTLENLEVTIDEVSEFHVLDKKFGFKNHSFAFQNSGVTRDVILKREATRLPFLARLLMEDLASCSKLFCYHDAGESSSDDISRLVEALNKYGKNSLVWVRAAETSHMSGRAERINEQLICAYVDRFEQLTNVKQPSFESWMAALRAAHELWQAAKKIVPANV